MGSFYFYYYSKKLREIYAGELGLKYMRILKKNNYIASINPIIDFKIIEDNKSKPLLTKILEKVVGIMIRFGFTIPIIAAFSSTGTGEEGISYFCVYLFLLLIPELMKINSQIFVYYWFLKQIEKDNNIIIYNGKEIGSK